jgi:hypothetical protein
MCAVAYETSELWLKESSKKTRTKNNLNRGCFGARSHSRSPVSTAENNMGMPWKDEGKCALQQLFYSLQHALSRECVCAQCSSVCGVCVRVCVLRRVYEQIKCVVHASTAINFGRMQVTKKKRQGRDPRAVDAYCMHAKLYFGYISVLCVCMYVCMHATIHGLNATCRFDNGVQITIARETWTISVSTSFAFLFIEMCLLRRT